MKTIEINGKTLNLDEDGHLENRDDWEIEFAKAAANVDDQELTDDHITVIKFARKYYEHYSSSPSFRAIRRAIGEKLGSTSDLYAMFPNGGHKQISKYAGLPRPTGCM